MKTRLVPLLGSWGAAELAKTFLQDTWASVSNLPWAKPVVASTEGGLQQCLHSPIEIWLQGEGDLGARLENISRRALSEHSYVIAVGADSPCLPVKYLELAREALHRADAVIGPSEDGGFYLLGLRKVPHGSSLRNPVECANHLPGNHCKGSGGRSYGLHPRRLV